MTHSQVTAFDEVTHQQLAFVTRRLNSRPRRRLNYLTPAEVFHKHRCT